MKIVMVEPGGFRATFQYTHNLCNALGRRGHEVILVTATEYETENFPREYDAIKVFDRFKPRIGLLRNLRRRMREFQPDIVHIQGHSHPTSYLLMRALIGSVCSARFVYTAQDVIPKKPLPHHFPALRRLYRVMEHIFVNAEHNKQMVIDRFGADPDKISVHPIPDLLDFLRIDNPDRSELVPDGKKVILFFGNIEPRKGVGPLIESFPAVLKEIPDAYLLIAGKPMGDDATVYEKQIADLAPEVQAQIDFHPNYLPLEEVPKVLTHAHASAMPYTEGWNSGAIATAFGYGKPVIATAIAGASEVIHDGENGFLVPPGDPVALAEAFVRLFSNEATMRKLAEGSKKSGENESWDVVAGQIESHYKVTIGT